VPSRFAIATGILSFVMSAAGCRSGSSVSARETGREDPVVATFGDDTVTLSELEAAATGRLRELDRRRFEILTETLAEVADERLILDEAAKRQMTREELLRAEIDDKVVAPTDADIQKYYDEHPNRTKGRPLDLLRPYIARELMEPRVDARKREFMAALKKDAQFTSFLEPPRVELPVPAGTPTRGPVNAKVTVVEFSDFECPYCRQMHEVLEQVQDDYEDRVRFVFRDFPLDRHPRARRAAEAAGCAGEQGRFWEYHDALMEGEGDLSDKDLKASAVAVGLDPAKFDQCLASPRRGGAIDETIEDGRMAGVGGTPTFFVNGRHLYGFVSYEEFKQLVEEELARAAS
jgi:protein-disulfide isomerase